MTDTPPTELDPLFNTIDPDALNHLFDSITGEVDPAENYVFFQFHRCTVRIDATGTIMITPPKDDPTITSSDSEDHNEFSAEREHRDGT